jgi:hypothetical protein
MVFLQKRSIYFMELVELIQKIFMKVKKVLILDFQKEVNGAKLFILLKMLLKVMDILIKHKFKHGPLMAIILLIDNNHLKFTRCFVQEFKLVNLFSCSKIRVLKYHL